MAYLWFIYDLSMVHPGLYLVESYPVIEYLVVYSIMRNIFLSLELISVMTSLPGVSWKSYGEPLSFLFYESFME